MRTNTDQGRVRLADMARAILSHHVGKSVRVYQTCSMGYDKGEPKTGKIVAVQKVKVYRSDKMWTSLAINFDDGTTDNRILEDFCHIADDGVYEWRV